jgi:ABC-type multidrug transport system fused ATPase/permease subunit
LKLPDHPLLSWRTLFFVPRQVYIAFLWTAYSITQIIFRIFGKKIRLSYGEPGHVCYFFFVQSLIGLLLAYPYLVLADIMTQVILVGRKMTETQAWLLGLDMASYTGVGQLIPDQRYQVLFIHIGITLGIRFFLIPILLFLGYYKTWILQRMNQDMRMALIDRWLLLSLRYHSDHRVGDSVYRIYQDSAMVTNVIVKVYEGSYALRSFLTAALVVCFFNPLLSMLIILGVLPIMAWGLWYSPRMRVYSRISREANSALVSRIQEICSGIRVVKAYGSEAREQYPYISSAGYPR